MPQKRSRDETTHVNPGKKRQRNDNEDILGILYKIEAFLAKLYPACNTILYHEIIAEKFNTTIKNADDLPFDYLLNLKKIFYNENQRLKSFKPEKLLKNISTLISKIEYFDSSNDIKLLSPANEWYALFKKLNDDYTKIHADKAAVAALYFNVLYRKIEEGLQEYIKTIDKSWVNTLSKIEPDSCSFIEHMLMLYPKIPSKLREKMFWNHENFFGNMEDVQTQLLDKTKTVHSEFLQHLKEFYAPLPQIEEESTSKKIQPTEGELSLINEGKGKRKEINFLAECIQNLLYFAEQTENLIRICDVKISSSAKTQLGEYYNSHSAGVEFADTHSSRGL